LKKHPWATAFAAVILLAVLAALSRHKIHFDFRLFSSQLALADWRRIILAIACVYAGIVIRSMRWVWLLRHSRKVPLIPLLGAQTIGFAAVALLGRVADLTRPYLVAKKTGLPVSLQFAVYVIERLFDAIVLALLFGATIFFSHAGLLRKAALAALIGAIVGALFVIALRLAGDSVPSLLVRILSPLSSKFAAGVGHKLRTFQAGLDAMRSLSDLAVVFILSACLWGLIAAAYFETTCAFVADRQLVSFTFAQCVPLLAVSSGASFFQLPVLGWFSQIALVAAGMSGIYHVSAEVATAWSAALLVVTFLSPLPAGLIWAQVDGISLRKVAAEANTQANHSA
jgi:uncharacterized membrane protein YbhN (UPF0104 family)